jgi:hypothetical protein
MFYCVAAAFLAKDTMVFSPSPYLAAARNASCGVRSSDLGVFTSSSWVSFDGSRPRTLSRVDLHLFPNGSHSFPYTSCAILAALGPYARVWPRTCVCMKNRLFCRHHLLSFLPSLLPCFPRRSLLCSTCSGGTGLGLSTDRSPVLSVVPLNFPSTQIIK